MTEAANRNEAVARDVAALESATAAIESITKSSEALQGNLSRDEIIAEFDKAIQRAVTLNAIKQAWSEGQAVSASLLSEAQAVRQALTKLDDPVAIKAMTLSIITRIERQIAISSETVLDRLRRFGTEVVVPTGLVGTIAAGLALILVGNTTTGSLVSVVPVAIYAFQKARQGAAVTFERLYQFYNRTYSKFQETYLKYGDVIDKANSYLGAITTAKEKVQQLLDAAGTAKTVATGAYSWFRRRGGRKSSRSRKVEPRSSTSNVAASDKSLVERARERAGRVTEQVMAVAMRPVQNATMENVWRMIRAQGGTIQDFEKTWEVMKSSQTRRDEVNHMVADFLRTETEPGGERKTYSKRKSSRAFEEAWHATKRLQQYKHKVKHAFDKFTKAKPNARTATHYVELQQTLFDIQQKADSDPDMSEKDRRELASYIARRPERNTLQRL